MCVHVVPGRSRMSRVTQCWWATNMSLWYQSGHSHGPISLQGHPVNPTWKTKRKYLLLSSYPLFFWEYLTNSLKLNIYNTELLFWEKQQQLLLGSKVHNSAGVGVIQAVITILHLCWEEIYLRKLGFMGNVLCFCFILPIWVIVPSDSEVLFLLPISNK